MANTLIGRLTPTNNMSGTLTNESRLTGQLGGAGAVVTYASLPDKPSINNVELVGNKTTSDLNLSYNDLRDQPVIPDVGEIDERLDDLESDTSALDGRLTTAEGNITSLSGRVTTAEGNITTLQGDTGALDTRLTTAEDGISDLQDDMTQAQSDITQLNSSKVSKVNTQLTLTRTANNYVDATSFARLAAVRKDNVLFFICNLALTASIPASALSDFVEIGRISGWSSAYTIMQQIPSQQSDGNSLSIRVTSNGIVSIFAAKAASSWYRTVVSVPASN